MPLVMPKPDVSTERRQTIVYDPAIYEEVKEATKKVEQLKREGFQLESFSIGKFTLSPPERDPNIGVFRILSENGDDRIVWDRRVPEQVKEAFSKFKEFISQGYRAFVAMANGKKGPRIDDFDPGLEEIIMGKEIVFVPKTMPG